MTGADPEFLERAFRSVKKGFALLILFNFLKYPMKMKLFGLMETKVFHLMGYLKTGGGGVRANPLTPRIRHCVIVQKQVFLT